MFIEKFSVKIVAAMLIAGELMLCNGCGKRPEDAAIAKAEKYGRSGRYDEAIIEFDKVIAMKSTARAYIVRGATYAAKGDLDHAIEDFGKAITIDTDSAEAYAGRGLAYAYKGNIRMGISECNRAIEIKPGYAAAYNTRAMIYFMAGQYDRSWKDLILARSLGHKTNPRFLEELKKASGREE
jgi:tetratricopeptide (TPR) repeat protein